jgi:hypothetical protein
MVDSVYHLSDPQQGADCQVFTASQQVTGVPVEPFALWTPTPGQACTQPNTAETIPSRFFHQDKNPGDTLGHNSRDVWFAAQP